MCPLSEDIREVGIREELYFALQPHEREALTENSFGMLARFRHPDLRGTTPPNDAAGNGDESFTALRTAMAGIRSSRSRSGAERAEQAFLPNIEKAHRGIARAESSVRRLGEAMAECVAGDLMEGPVASSLPPGDLVLFLYLTPSSVGLSVAHRADDVRAGFRAGSIGEEEVDEYIATYGDPNLIVTRALGRGGVLRERAGGRIVGFLYARSLESELGARIEARWRMPGWREHGIPSAGVSALFELFSPRLYLPADSDVGIFALTQRITSTGIMYRIEGEVLSFHERGEDD